jgi:hypothetical protein
MVPAGFLNGLVLRKYKENKRKAPLTKLMMIFKLAIEISAIFLLSGRACKSPQSLTNNVAKSDVKE